MEPHGALHLCRAAGGGGGQDEIPPRRMGAPEWSWGPLASFFCFFFLLCFCFLLFFAAKVVEPTCAVSVVLQEEGNPRRRNPRRCTVDSREGNESKWCVPPQTNQLILLLLGQPICIPKHTQHHRQSPTQKKHRNGYDFEWGTSSKWLVHHRVPC